MKNNIVGIAVIALIVGLGAGYMLGGKSDSKVSGTSTDDSMSMMMEQSARISQMGEMMKTGAMMMQQAGVKYKDEELVNTGKDMQTIAEKHMGEDSAHLQGDSMTGMMGHSH
jgi:hypothetical protein